MVSGHSVMVDAEGKARQRGVHFGGKDQQPRLIRRAGEYALFHVPGGSFWDGSNHVYHPTTYDLVRLVDVDKGEGVAFTAGVSQVIESREPGHKWQAAKRELLAKLVSLVVEGLAIAVDQQL
jgi:hypothetical protein